MRSTPTSPPLTLDDAIEVHKRRALGEAQHVIAAGFGVNPGRISEILTGRRFPEAKCFADHRNKPEKSKNNKS